jgi:hypothetical protein
MTAIAKIDPVTNLIPADPMVSMIERVAMDPNSDLTKLERMIELKERHDATNARAEFAAAFAKASASFPTIPLNGKSNNGMYATLEDITKLTRPVLSEHGLAMTFAVVVGQDVVVTAKLMHKAGHCEETSMALPRDTSGSKNAVQAVGSTQKYGQRYTAQAILGLSLGKDDEDDGRGSGPITSSAPKRTTDQWTATILQDMPDDATPRDKAQAVAQALCAQFKRMKGEKQIGNEWDRRAHLIERMESSDPDLHETVCDAYANRLEEIKEPT